MMLQGVKMVIMCAVTSVFACDVCAQVTDTVVLDDGSVLQGTIVREKDGYVWLDTGSGEVVFLVPERVVEIRDEEPKVRQSGLADEIPLEKFLSEPYQIKAWEDDPEVTRAAVISAEGMVGMQFAAKPLREAIPILKEEGIELVVISVHSGGGLVSEVMPISDVLHEEYKPEFELVGWVNAAVSAAGVVCFSFETMYFRGRGVLGAMASVWARSSTGEGAGFQQDELERLAARGGHSAMLVKPLLGLVPLSLDLNQDSGEVTLYNSLEGERVLGDGTYLLHYNSDAAELVGLSKGTSETTQELALLLQEEHGEIEWVGESVEGFDYPVCKAERHQIEYRKEVEFQETRWQEIMGKYQMEVQNAQGVPVDRRGGFIRRAESYLARIKRMLDINPNFGILYVGEQWVRQQEEILRELRRG